MSLLRMRFRAVSGCFPDSELADNAQYWLAESHYVTQKFEAGVERFRGGHYEVPTIPARFLTRC